MEEKQETGLGESNEDIRENDSPEETALPAEAEAVAPADGDADGVTVEPVGDPAAESTGVAPDASPDTENGAGKPGQNVIGSLLDYLEIFAFSVAAVLVVFTMLFRLCRVDGSSMRKTLENGQMLITTSVGEPEPGDMRACGRAPFRPGVQVVRMRAAGCLTSCGGGLQSLFSTLGHRLPNRHGVCGRKAADGTVRRPSGQCGT